MGGVVGAAADASAGGVRLGRVLRHLERLVSCPTENPPRSIGGDDPAVRYCRGVLGEAGCAVTVSDAGDGCVTLLATRDGALGAARTVVNCHLDTVPADPSWTRDPFRLSVEGDRAYGLGACDVKGAAACMLAAVEESAGAVALLLTTDEEAGRSRCVRSFLGGGIGYDRAVVAEPTGVRAVTEHRGLATYDVRFEGVAAHSSTIGADQRNAVHLAARWCSEALALARRAPFDDIRLNIGTFHGGAKANVAASSATVTIGMRPPAGMHPDEVVRALGGLASSGERSSWAARFCAPGLAESAGAAALIEDYGFERGGPVDFWTEAALFGQAGLATVVLGPGDIGQAHAADEFVALEDLRRAACAYGRVFSEAGVAADAGEKAVS